MKAAPRASPRTFGNFPEDIYSVTITKANDSFSSRLIRKLFLPVSLEYSYCLERPGTSLPLFASIFFLVVTTSSASMRKKPNGQANTFLYVVPEFLFQFFNLKKKSGQIGRHSPGCPQAHDPLDSASGAIGLQVHTLLFSLLSIPCSVF